MRQQKLSITQWQGLIRQQTYEQNIGGGAEKSDVKCSLTASLRQIFFSSFVFLAKISWISCSFFLSSESFSFFCSSLISESPEPGTETFSVPSLTQYSHSRYLFCLSLRKTTMTSPVDTRLPLLAVIKLFFRQASPSRFIFAPACSVRSMAISSKLLAAPNLA